MYDGSSQLSLTGAGVSVLGLTMGLYWPGVLAAILTVVGLIVLSVVCQRTH